MEHFQFSTVESPASCALLHAFDALAFGAILLDEGRCVLHVNRCAEQHLGAGITIQAGHLGATDAGSDRILQDLLTDGLDRPGKRFEAIGLRRAELQPLVLRLQPVHEEARAGLDGASLMAVLVDPEYCPEPRPAFLQQAFGLTRKEAEVAVRLMCGRTIREIADETGIRLGTARAQTKAVLAKTGTKRQAELVGLLTRLAVAAGGLS